MYRINSLLFLGVIKIMTHGVMLQAAKNRRRNEVYNFSHSAMNKSPGVYNYNPLKGGQIWAVFIISQEPCQAIRGPASVK